MRGRDREAVGYQLHTHRVGTDILVSERRHGM